MGQGGLCGSAELGCGCWVAAAPTAAAFFYFFKQNKRAKSTEENERYEEEMNIPLEYRNYVVFDKIELGIFRGRKIIQV